jgi:hypothetical protein
MSGIDLTCVEVEKHAEILKMVDRVGMFKGREWR